MWKFIALAEFFIVILMARIIIQKAKYDMIGWKTKRIELNGTITNKNWSDREVGVTTKYGTFTMHDGGVYDVYAKYAKVKITVDVTINDLDEIIKVDRLTKIHTIEKI